MKSQNKKGGNIHVGLVVGVGLLAALALFIRVCPSYDDVFSGAWVKFASNDAYYYMRLVDNMVHNFPHMMTLDPYLRYPDGQAIGYFYLFGRLIASVSWLIGLGEPTQRIVDMVGAYVPAVMGALVVVPVYFIGRELGGRWAGLLCAALIAVMPGEFLGRSIVGFTDHHIAEVLFATVAMMFLVLALRVAKQGDWRVTTWKQNSRAVAYSVLAGLFFGVYCLTWHGCLLFVFIVSLFFATQFIINHMRRENIEYLCLANFVFYLVAMAVFLPSLALSPYISLWVASFTGALILPLVLYGLSRLVDKRKMASYYYPMGVLGFGGVALGIMYLVSPSMFQSMTSLLLVFVPNISEVTTTEMQSLFFPTGVFSWATVWSNFSLAFFIGMVAWGVLVYMSVKHGDATKTLIVVWGIVILAMAIGQRRFAYYLAVNVTLLAGWLLWQGMKWTMLNVGETKHNRSVLGNEVNVALTAVVVFFVAFLPIIPQIGVSSKAYFVPTNAWCESLDWLGKNSPEPFSDPDGYWKLPEALGQSKATYSVLSWWDYGYWITRIAHRVPNVNPGQQPLLQVEVGKFLTAQSEKAANEIAHELGARYVIIDLPIVVGKFWAIAQYAEGHYSDYFGIYYMPNGNQFAPVQVYYPAYYRSMAVRLYTFDGKAVIPVDVTVISYEGIRDTQGNSYNVITEVRMFNDYNTAELYAKEGNRRVISDNPLVSPVPLEAVRDYKVVYNSSQKVSVGGVGDVSEVKIFRYLG